MFLLPILTGSVSIMEGLTQASDNKYHTDQKLAVEAGISVKI